jgi:hypothetical protein
MRTGYFTVSGTTGKIEPSLPAEPATSPPKRRWQFSLRGLLVAMVLLGAVGGWLGSHVQRSVAQRRATARLQQAGAEVTLTVAGPPTLRRWLGDRWFERADVVTFRQSNCGDAALADLAALSGLRVLRIDSPEVTDRALEYLHGHTDLQQLWVAGTQIGSPGLASLEGFDRLEVVGLAPSQCDPVAVAWLVARPKLNSVAVIGSGLTLEQSRGLEEVRGLRSLLLLGGAATDTLAPALAEFTQLELLYLESPAVTDGTLDALGPLTRLRNLLLVNTAVTDQGVSRVQAANPLVDIKIQPPRQPAGP